MIRRALIVLCLGCFSPMLSAQQFNSPVPQPYTLDRVAGEFINYETQMIKPVLVTFNKRVVVANEPNGTLDVFDVNFNKIRSIVLGQGIASIAERRFNALITPVLSEIKPASSPSRSRLSADSIGQDPTPGPTPGPTPILRRRSELWVSVRHQQAIAVISTSSWLVTHWIRPPVLPNDVGYGDADHLGQIVFNSNVNATKAYVSCFNTDKVAVFNATNKTYTTSVDLFLDHNGIDSDLNTPYSMVRAGQSVYVVSQLSGNQTIPEALVPFPGFGPPDRFLITDLTLDPTRSLPDFDIMEIDMATDTVVDHKSDVGSASFNIAYHAATDQLVVCNLHHRNGEFVGEASWTDGRVAFNRLTFIDRSGPPAGSPPAGHNHVVIEDLVPGSPDPVNVAMPTDIVIDGSNRIFVAGTGSSNIGVFDTSGGFIGEIPTDAVPRGLVRSGGRLYVYSRGENRLLWYDVSGTSLPTTPGNSVDLTDPTPENIKEGRKIFFDSGNSGFLSTSCATCHIDGRKAGLCWDLSQFHDDDTEKTVNNQPSFWKDRKGVQVTQDLRSLPEVPGYHWRGEQHDLEFFNGAFAGLLHGSRLDDDDFALFKTFVFSMRYPPNPFQQLNRNYTSDAVTGLNFMLEDDPGDVFQCNNCHEVPLGTNNDITIPITGFGDIGNLTPQLRGLWTKESSRCNINNSVPGIESDVMTGFGLLNNGRIFDSDHFMEVFFGGAPTAQIQAAMNEFDDGLSPAAVYSEHLKQSTVAQNRVAFMVEQAEAFNCDVAGRGRMRVGGVWRPVGLIWERAPDMFSFDDSTLADVSQTRLIGLATTGVLDVIMICTPVGSGERFGVDIDRDGIRDTDEINAGLDPEDPDSDGDGQWESYDLDPANPSAPPLGPVNASNVQVEYETTNSIKVTWTTDAFSPTRLVYGLTTAYDEEDGDPFPISLAPNTSKLWKTEHTAFIRVTLLDNTLYNFAIVTQGQNGVISQTPNMTATTAEENGVFTPAINPSVRVTGLTLLPITGPPSVIWVANVTVTDNAAVPTIAGTDVTGIFTHFVGDTPMAEEQVTGTISGSTGMISFLSSFTGQASGDFTNFTIPQLVDPNGTGSRVLSIVNGTGVFLWPESDPTSVEEVLP